jgi:hypothetical protein
VQLHLFDQVLDQAMPGDVGASSDGGVTVYCQVSGELDGGAHTVRNESGLDSPLRCRRWWSVGHHELGPPVWSVIPSTGAVPGAQPYPPNHATPGGSDQGPITPGAARPGRAVAASIWCPQPGSSYVN